MVRMFFAAALAILGLTAPKAQERAPNPGTQTQLREWPISGVWGVRLIRIVDGSLGCWLGTGHADQTSGEQYLWGVRWRPENIGATITDNNQRAIAGPSIQI